MAGKKAAAAAPAAKRSTSRSRSRLGQPAPSLKTPPYDRRGRILAEKPEEAQGKAPSPEQKPQAAIKPAAQLLATQVASELNAAAAAWDAGQAADYFSSQATAGRVTAFAKGLAARLPEEMGSFLLGQVAPMVQNAVAAASAKKKSKKPAPSLAMLGETARIISNGSAEGKLGPMVTAGLESVFRHGLPAGNHGAVLLREI